MSRITFSLLLAFLILFAALGIGCGSRSGSDAPASPPQAVDDTGRVPADSASADGDSLEVDGDGWSTERIWAERRVAEIAVVTGLRGGRHEEYDRYVVEFQGSEVPGYIVHYLDDQAMECGSGEAIELAGTAVLEIHLEPARGYTEGGAATVRHAKQRLDLDTLLEADVSCDFEAVFGVVLGAAARGPFRITELSNPARLVVDVRRPDR